MATHEAAPYVRKEERQASEPLTVKDMVAESISSLIAEIEDLLRKPISPSGEDRPLTVDEEAATRILETAPHPPANRNPEDLTKAAEILAQIKAEDTRGAERMNVSEHMDDYIN